MMKKPNASSSANVVKEEAVKEEAADEAAVGTTEGWAAEVKAEDEPAGEERGDEPEAEERNEEEEETSMWVAHRDQEQKEENDEINDVTAAGEDVDLAEEHEMVAEDAYVEEDETVVKDEPADDEEAIPSASSHGVCIPPPANVSTQSLHSSRGVLMRPPAPPGAGSVMEHLIGWWRDAKGVEYQISRQNGKFSAQRHNEKPQKFDLRWSADEQVVVWGDNRWDANKSFVLPLKVPISPQEKSVPHGKKEPLHWFTWADRSFAKFTWHPINSSGEGRPREVGQLTKFPRRGHGNFQHIPQWWG